MFWVSCNFKYSTGGLRLTKHPRSLWSGDALGQTTTHPLGQVQAHRAGQTEDKSYLRFDQPLRPRGRRGWKTLYAMVLNASCLSQK